MVQQRRTCYTYESFAYAGQWPRRAKSCPMTSNGSTPADTATSSTACEIAAVADLAAAAETVETSVSQAAVIQQLTVPQQWHHPKSATVQRSVPSPLSIRAFPWCLE